MTDRVEQVCLSEATLTVDKQRVVRLGGCFGDGDGSGVSKSVARSDDEGLEDVLGIEAM